MSFRSLKTPLIILASFVFPFLLTASPLAVGEGIGFLASEDNAESTWVNPAGLHPILNDTASLSFAGPSFTTGEFFTVLKTSYKILPVGLGITFLPSGLQRIQSGLPIPFKKIPWLKLGAAISLDREHRPDEPDRFGFGCSAGLILDFPSEKSVKKNTHNDLSIGLSGLNLYTWNEFAEGNDVGDRQILAGLRFETFLHELIVNAGGSWNFDAKFPAALGWSAGLEYGGIGRIKIRDLLLGEPRFGAVRYPDSTAAFLSWTIRSHTFILSYETGGDGDFYEVGYRLKAMSRPLAPVAPKKAAKPRRKATAADLERQKSLLNEGLQLYKTKQYDEAVAVWERSIRIEPENETATEARGYIEKVRELLKGIEE